MPRRRSAVEKCDACGTVPAFRQMENGRYTDQLLCSAHGWPRRTPEYGVLRAGDEVKVTGLPGSYHFLALVESRNGAVYAELYGGRNGKHPSRLMRTVEPGRIKIPSERVLVRQRRLRAERKEDE